LGVCILLLDTFYNRLSGTNKMSNNNDVAKGKLGVVISIP